jgi:hypothetical protein
MILLPPNPPPRNVWQCLETFSVIITGGGGATDIYKVEPRDAAKHPMRHRIAPQQKIVQPKMSIVLTSRNLRNPRLEEKKTTKGKKAQLNLQSQSKTVSDAKL